MASKRRSGSTDQQSFRDRELKAPSSLFILLSRRLILGNRASGIQLSRKLREAKGTIHKRCKGKYIKRYMPFRARCFKMRFAGREVGT